jgi:UDP-MurNAc hydroxylase
VNNEQTFEVLRVKLENKLAQLSLADRVTAPLYFRFNESDELMLRVDFRRRAVEYASANDDTRYYEIVTPGGKLRKTLLVS